MSQSLIVYEVMTSELSTSNRLQIQLNKLNHELILRERRRVARKRQADAADDRTTHFAKNLLRTFDNIGGYSGVR